LPITGVDPYGSQETYIIYNLVSGGYGYWLWPCLNVWWWKV